MPCQILLVSTRSIIAWGFEGRSSDVPVVRIPKGWPDKSIALGLLLWFDAGTVSQ